MTSWREELEKLTFDEVVSIKMGLEILGDESVFLGCLDAYAKMFKESFDEMHKDWRSQDVKKCYSSAHKFKGATSYACCMPLLDALKIYNLECRNGNLDKGNEIYPTVLKECRKASYILSKKFDLPDEADYFTSCSKIFDFLILSS